MAEEASLSDGHRRWCQPVPVYFPEHIFRQGSLPSRLGFVLTQRLHDKPRFEGDRGSTSDLQSPVGLPDSQVCCPGELNDQT